MSQNTPTQTEVVSPDKSLIMEFVDYVRMLKFEWLRDNRIHSKDVYEVAPPNEQEEYRRRINEWGKYITPFAEAWWEKRGWRVIWPEDNSEPMQYSRL